MSAIGKNIEDEIYNIFYEQGYIKTCADLFIALEKAIPENDEKTDDIARILDPIKMVSKILLK